MENKAVTSIPFVGYRFLTQLAEHMRREELVNVLEYSYQASRDKMGLTYHDQVLMVSQLTNGQVLYWRIKVGTLTFVSGELYPGEDIHEKRVTSALECVTSYLREQGFTLRSAAVDEPVGFRHLEGDWKDIMTYFKKDDVFRRTPATFVSDDKDG